MTAVGMDLGTSKSCVAVWRNDRAEVIANDHGNRTTPSCVAFRDTERVIGDGAQNQVASNPENTVFDAKRLIGRKFQDPMVQADIKLWPFKCVAGQGDKPMIIVNDQGVQKKFHPEEISSMILLKMKETAEAYLGTTITDVVVTVPAYFNNSQRQATKDAATISGMKVLGIINEPTAAAIAYGLDLRGTRERNVLIYDLGGGTFDVSLLTIKDGHFEVKATAGDTHLGGEDFDNRVVDFCMKDFKRKNPGRDLTGNHRAIRRLRAECERAKRVLSGATQANIEIDYLLGCIGYSCSLSRARFEELCMDYFRETMRHVEQCLKDSGVDKNSVDDVVLVGGSTRIPKVQSMIEQFFGRAPSRSINPDEAVAYGAAVQAAILTHERSSKIRDSVVVDVTPLSVGLETADGVMATLIEGNTIIPITKAQKFNTVADNRWIPVVEGEHATPNLPAWSIPVVEGEHARPNWQPGMPLQVFEGEHQMTKHKKLVGTCYGNVPPTATELKVSLHVDENGMPRVSASYKDQGKNCEITPDLQKDCCLSRSEVEDITRKHKELRALDEEKKNRIEAQDRAQKANKSLENLCFTVRASGIRNCSQPGHHKDTIKSAVQETLDWLDKNQLASEDEFEAKKQELEHVVNPIMMIYQAQQDMSDGMRGGMRAGTGPTVEEVD